MSRTLDHPPGGVVDQVHVVEARGKAHGRALARATGRAPARLADTVGLHLAGGPIHLFHPTSGQRIT